VKLWCDGAHDPAENMRRDAWLLERAEAGELAGPVLRLFAFQPHGITLGAGQDPARVLDLERCERDGVSWAVRPTGGRAIFHAEEWTYSLTARIDDPAWGGTLREAYAGTASLLIASLVRLGVPVRPAPAERGDHPPDPAAAAACFAATAGHEIAIGERKLVGSAQRRLSRAFLQQGSLLLSPGHLRLCDYLALGEAERAAARTELERRTADAGRWLGGAPLERWADALAAALETPPDRVDGPEASGSLTLAEAGSYTPAPPVRISPRRMA